MCDDPLGLDLELVCKGILANGGSVFGFRVWVYQEIHTSCAGGFRGFCVRALFS